MHRDNLHTAEEVRTKLKAGIDKVANAVGATMGTGGSNAIIEAIESPGHLMTNDGYSIANAVLLADPIEDMGRKILLESINRANKQSGDGSSTTCVLTAAIINEGMGHLGEATPMEIKRSLEACLPLIEASIKAQTKEIDASEVGKVATISAEDAEIGATIQTIYEKIGKTGIIHWDISKTAEDSFSIGQGITIEGAGLYSPYMADATETGQSTNSVRLKDPHVLITKQKISSASEFNDIAQALYNKEVRDVVVFCDDVDPLVIPDIIKTRMVRGFRFVFVKMPVLWKDQWFEDLALASGATIIDPAGVTSLKGTKMEHLGRFDNITVTKDDTFIDGIKDISGHIKDLEEGGTDDSMLRASRLNTKTARYYVGAPSDSALSYRRLKVEDAISAAWQALNGGIVAGGGVALLNASKFLPNNVGGSILGVALVAPLRQIADNAGRDSDGALTVKGVGKVPKDGESVVGGEMGLDSRSMTIVNMFEAGIIDPANVVRNAVNNAISVAAAVLTANTVVTLPRLEQSEAPTPPVVR